MNSIEVRKAYAGYQNDSTDQNFVLGGLNMTVAPGSIYTLIGASGCGKTTLLSCILGMKSLDSGTIKVLGHQICPDKPSKVSHIIGYMPQDIALSLQLTISETLNYFGNLFLMNKQELKERSQMIKELLELPSDDREIQNLSGGQRRRVSLAAAIIHNPLILILDEPTVGLDSILREKIWKFLIKSTSESNLSIIITTHYISEAQLSNRCGMMRDGILLTEDSPTNILQKYKAENLDEAFLNLCKLSKQVLPICDDSEIVNDIGAGQDKNDVDELTELTHFRGRRERISQILWTLFLKEWTCLKRGKMELIANFFYMPLLSIMLIFGPGGNPNGLKLGVVNYEVIDQSICDYFVNQNASYRNDFNICVYDHLSCHFLNEFQDDYGTMVFYNSFDEAYEDAKRGKIPAVITIQRNFSSALQFLHENFNGTAIEFSEINVHLDQTDLQISTFIQNRLLKMFFSFGEKIMKGCNYNENYVQPSLNVTPMFGSLYENFRKSILPILLFQSGYIQAVASSCYRISQSKVDGIWNRTLLAGVHPVVILLVQFVFSTIIIVISFFNGLLVLFLSLDIVNLSTMLISLALGVSLCISGIFMGMMMSTITKNASFITGVIFGGSLLACTTAGLFWPIEGQPEWFQKISYTLPFAFTSTALRNVIMKNFTFESSVQKGFLIVLSWIIGTLLFTLVAIRKRKFS